MKNTITFLLPIIFSAFYSLPILAVENKFSDIHFNTFTPKPLAGSPSIKFTDLKNHVVLIDFWASWCNPCKEAIPHYNKLSIQYKDQGLLILGINEDDSADDRDAFLKSTSVQFPIYADAKREFLKVFDVEALPTLFVLDKQNKIVLSLRGLSQKNLHSLDEKIKALVKE